MSEKQVISDSNIGGYKKPVMSVGEEFMAWAETYWGLGKIFDGTVEGNSEKEGYVSVKDAFIKQINNIIETRVKHYF